VILDSNTPDDPARVVRPQPLLCRRLRDAGIAVVVANLFYNRFDGARTYPPSVAFHREWGDTPADAWVPAQQRWQTLHNVEDHRKNLVIDGGARALITSHNLIDVAHDWHENAFVFDGGAARAVWAQAQLSLARALEIPQRIDDDQRAMIAALIAQPVASSACSDVTVLANEEIRTRFDAVIGEAGAGDELDLATAYFSDRPTWHALVAAAERGARVRVLIDDLAALPLPSVTGAVVRGLANRAVLDLARTTAAPNLELRVFGSSAGAMMHLKTLIRRGRAPVVIGGQCNATPNSFSGAWLETDVEVRRAGVVGDATAHFDDLWAREDSRPLAPPGRWFAPKRWLASAALAAFAAVGLSP
jgi:phosphatidylserine/phosphatidylglycerophosphate/cardiolipin synthase-like enzyme